MDQLRQKISDLFNNSAKAKVNPTTEKIQSEPMPNESKIAADTVEPKSSEDTPMPEIKEIPRKPSVANFSYEMEFVDFLDRHSPQGLSKKFMDMLPYLEISFLSWPAYWFYRGYNWHNRRNTERISVYIQRTYQQAKFMQVAILATGAFAINMSRSPFQVQKVECKKHNKFSKPT